MCTSKMLTTVLDEVREQFSEFGNVPLKIGFYSEFKFRKLVIMVEPMIETTNYEPLNQDTHIKTIDQYFEEYPLKNPVYKITADFFIYVNGIRLLNPDVLLTPHDSLEVRYKISNKIPITKN